MVCCGKRVKIFFVLLFIILDMFLGSMALVRPCDPAFAQESDESSQNSMSQSNSIIPFANVELRATTFERVSLNSSKKVLPFITCDLYGGLVNNNDICYADYQGIGGYTSNHHKQLLVWRLGSDGKK